MLDKDKLTKRCCPELDTFGSFISRTCYVMDNGMYAYFLDKQW